MARVKTVVFLAICLVLCLEIRKVRGWIMWPPMEMDVCASSNGPAPASGWGAHGTTAVAHYDFCASLSGNSPGSSRFCKRCILPFDRVGLGFYWQIPWFALYSNSAPAFKPMNPTVPMKLNPEFGEGINQDLFKVELTGIEVGSEMLEGWFHIQINGPGSPGQYIPYALIVQVEETATFRAAGEFTTELNDHCEGIGLEQQPTQAQILPCHAATEHSPEVSNMAVWYSDADSSSTNQSIRAGSKGITEFHFDWKIPSDFGCSFKNDYFVRVDMATVNDSAHFDAFENCVSLPDCRRKQPNAHTSNRIRIHLPKLTTKFHAPDPLPFLHRGQKVNCKAPILKSPTPDQAYWTEKELTMADVDTECPQRECKGERICTHDVWKTPVCRAPGADFKYGSCTLQAGVNRNRKEFMEEVCDLGNLAGLYSYVETWSKDRPLGFPKRELFLGRCIQQDLLPWKPEAKGNEHLAWYDSNEQVHGSARYEKILPTEPLVCRRFVPQVGTFTPSSTPSSSAPPDPDTDFVENELETAAEYVANFQYDNCNCYPPPPPDEGNVKFDDLEPPVIHYDDDYESFGVPVKPPQARSGRSGNTLVYLETRAKSENVHEDVGTLMADYSAEELQAKIRANVMLAHTMHGTLVALIFLVLIPCGVFVARYWKETFYGKTFLVYEIWYTLHLIFVTLSGICFFISHVILVVYHIYDDMLVFDDGNGVSRSVVHEIVGWVAFVFFCFLACFGGIRLYSEKNDKRLNSSIIFHAVSGFMFYFFGLLAMLLYTLKAHNFAGMGMVMARIVLDILFHLGMTLIVKKTDKKEGIKRKLFPMELIIDDREATGKKRRLVLSGLYIVLSFVIFLGFVILIVAKDSYENAQIKVIPELFETLRKDRL